MYSISPFAKFRSPVIFLFFSLFFTLGLFNPSVVLADPDCYPSQTVFSFGECVVDMDNATGYMDVTNNSDEMLEIDLQLDSPHFSHGGLHIWLEPGETYPLNPHYHPVSAGYHETIMSLGNELCQDVLLTGTGLERSCTVEPAFLDFGEVNLGEYASRTLSLVNDGDVEFSIDPYSSSPVVTVFGSSATLGPGETVEFEVRFIPDGPGDYSGAINWGAMYPTCDGVRFSGEGQVDMEPGENRVGVFFDTGYTQLIHYNDGSFEFLTGYLVLTNPSEPGGVAGWELLPGIDGLAYILNWDIEGDYINAGQGDELIIGIGGDPLPPAEEILLASCEVYVAESVDEMIAVQLQPVWEPSITGRMAWLPAGSSELQVMLPFTGVESVAWIQTPGVSAINDPIPAVENRLLGNAPNPFNPSTEIRFVLAAAQNARLDVYDLKGRLIRTLLDSYLSAGNHAQIWDGRDSAGRSLSSGAYYVRLKVGLEVSSRKIMLLK